MSFSLTVQTAERPSDLVAIWGPALAKRGMTVEFRPGLTLENSQGLLVAKVVSAPANLTRLEVKGAVAACFEFWSDDEGFGFGTSSGRTTVDFALQCLCAAALAEHLGASYVDPQMGQSAQGADAFNLAMFEIHYFISLPEEKVFRDFVDWETI